MVELKDLTPGTIVLGLNGKIAIVTEIKPNNTKYPVIYSYSTDANGYKGNERDFKAILGIGDLDVWNNSKPAPKPRVTGWDEDFLVPQPLKGIKIGDAIEIGVGTRKEVVTYKGYNSRRKKYPVSYTDSKGREMKCTLSYVLGKAS